MTQKPFELPMFARAASPTRDALEQARLSRLPPVPRRPSCANCGNPLDPNDSYQTAVKLCRDCLRTYANIGTILDRHAEAKIRRNYTEGR